MNFEEWQDVAHVDEGLVAWNYGQILQVEGLTLPDGNVEVHFSLTDREGDANPYIGTVKDNVLTVDIPDFIFQKENVFQPVYGAYAFIYQADKESGRTIKKIAFTIQVRPKPTTNVPEDQKDQFLEEVRQIMAETKDIAQSVRDDADNGVFDGEQGPKGDAGGLGCIPCKELPTTDIVSNVYYLLENGTEEIEVKGETVVKNKYTEYMYINGEWEIVGSISIGMNLSDYVKKDDYATRDKAGVVYANSVRGISVLNDGGLIISPANSDNVDSRNAYAPITGKIIDYAVKKALSDCKLSGDDVWTEEEKAKALELLGGVAKIPESTTDTKMEVYTNRYNNVTQRNTCMLDVYKQATKFAIPTRNSNGGIYIPDTALKDDSAIPSGEVAVNKKYVDDLVGSVESILTELHTYAQTKIGGEA